MKYHVKASTRTMEDEQGHIPQHPFEGHSIPKQVYQTLPAGAAPSKLGSGLSGSSSQ